MLNDDLKRRVRDANNIVDVIQAVVGKMTRAGRNWKACCPFHNEKTPSFNVNAEGQYFKCFGCGKSGDVFSFIMLHERVEFPEALKILADRAGIPFEQDPRAAAEYQKEKDQKGYLYKLNEAAANFYREQLFQPCGKHALAYLEKRGLNDEICKKFGIGYAPSGGSQLLAKLRSQRAPDRAILFAGLGSQWEEGGPLLDFFKDRLMFPIRDMQGRYIGFGGRILGEGNPKYLNTRDTPLFHKKQTVYGLDLAKETIGATKKAILVEGYTDVMMCHQFGVTNVVACLGTAITTEHIRLLRRVADELLMLTDSDAAGARASEKSLAVLMSEQMPAKIARLPGEDKDPCDFLLSKGRDAFITALDQPIELFEYKFERIVMAHDIRTPLGMKNAATELMALISQVPDQLIKNEYRRRVSARLNISEKDLEFAAQRAASAPALQEKTESDAGELDGVVPPPEHDQAKAERELLRFLFHEPAWMEATVSRVDLLTFSGRTEKIIGKAILQAMAEGSLPPDPSILAEQAVSSIVAREVLRILYSLPDEDVRQCGAVQVCVELADSGAGTGKLDAEAKFDMLLKPVKLNVLNLKLQEWNRQAAHARRSKDEVGEEHAFLEAAAIRKEIARVKSAQSMV